MSSVDANYRFIAASNEVNARIAQRQQTLALYVTLVLGLMRDRTGSLQPGLWTLVAAAALVVSLAPSLSPTRRHDKLRRAGGMATQLS